MKKKNKIISLILIIISIIGLIITLWCASKDLTSISNPMPPRSIKLSSLYIIIITILITSISLISIYLIKPHNFYKNTDKLIIYILENIIIITLSTIIIVNTTNKYILNNNNKYYPNNNETKNSITLDKSNIASSNTIDLSKETTSITITNPGSYTITGVSTYPLIIDTSGIVELILDNVNITTSNTATIIGLNAEEITITLKEGTTNTLSDGGSSEYDGCIFSNANLIFNGTGTLIVNGLQEEGEGIATEAKDITFNGGNYQITSNDDGINAGGDGATITINDGSFYINASGDGIDSNKDAIINGGTIFVIGSDTGGDSGIDTDEGYTINGGLVIALGSDMIETPKDTSTQNTLAFVLDNSISKDTIVSLLKDDELVVSFEAPKSFKTIIISTPELTNDTYSIYTDGTNSGTLNNGIYSSGTYELGNILSINNNTTFTITKKINVFGNTERR